MTGGLAFIFLLGGAYWLYKHPGILLRAAGLAALLVTGGLLTAQSLRRGLGVPWTRLAALAAFWKLGAIARHLRAIDRRQGDAQYEALGNRGPERAPGETQREREAA